MTDHCIRHFSPADQASVYELSADTAYFGEPVEAFLEDRKLYWDAFGRYYAMFETPFAWVAEIDQELIGFLFGCIDTSTHTKRWRKYIVNWVLLNALRGRYTLGRLTARFAKAMLFGLIRGEAPTADLDTYPAHLQIDVKAAHRGRGVGKGLIEAYLEQLRLSHIPGVHLETTSYNLAACHLYEKVGFQLLDSRLNRYWSDRMGFRVDNRSYGLRLR